MKHIFSILKLYIDFLNYLVKCLKWIKNSNLSILLKNFLIYFLEETSMIGKQAVTWAGLISFWITKYFFRNLSQLYRIIAIYFLKKTSKISWIFSCFALSWSFIISSSFSKLLSVRTIIQEGGKNNLGGKEWKWFKKRNWTNRRRERKQQKREQKIIIYR